MEDIESILGELEQAKEDLKRAEREYKTQQRRVAFATERLLSAERYRNQFVEINENTDIKEELATRTSEQEEEDIISQKQTAKEVKIAQK